MQMRLPLALTTLFLIIGPTHAISNDQESAQAVLLEGKQIVTKNCKSCHGVGKADKSTHPDAPPFREVASRYSVWLLAESLAEGIVSGHPDMPEFVFEPREINAILSYMDSLKELEKKPD